MPLMKCCVFIITALLLMQGNWSYGETVPWQDPRPLGRNNLTELTQGTTPAVATDQENRWIVVFSAPANAHGTPGTDSEIYFTRSYDDCQTWTAPAPLNMDYVSDTSPDSDPTIAVSPDGTWMCVWGRGSGDSSSLLFSYSHNQGVTWSMPALVDPALPAGRDPGLAFSTTKGWVLAYENAILIEQRTMPTSATTWGPSTLVASGTYMGACHTITGCTISRRIDPEVVAGQGNKTITSYYAYSSSYRNDFYVGGTSSYSWYSTNGIGTWFRLLLQSPSPAPYTTLELSRSTDNGSTFQPVTRPEYTFPEGKGRTAGFDNVVVMTWVQFGIGEVVLVSSMSRDLGENWSEVSEITDPISGPENLVMLNDNAGRFLAVWQENASAEDQQTKVLRYSTFQFPRAGVTGDWNLY